MNESIDAALVQALTGCDELLRQLRAHGREGELDGARNRSGHVPALAVLGQGIFVVAAKGDVYRRQAASPPKRKTPY